MTRGTRCIDAVRRLAEQARQGTLKPQQIDEAVISSALYTGGMPDPGTDGDCLVPFPPCAGQGCGRATVARGLLGHRRPR